MIFWTRDGDAGMKSDLDEQKQVLVKFMSHLKSMNIDGVKH